jgi:hypothetical protein
MRTRTVCLVFVLLVGLPSLVTCVPPASPTPSPTGSELVEVTVYFTDQDRYAAGLEPYEVGVARSVSADAYLPEVVLSEFFAGPTPAEQAQGLVAIASGATGFSWLSIEGGIARVYLNGACSSNGATYTIAQPIMKNLRQFDEVEHVKIYDDSGETEVPEGPSDSIPFCLEP